MSFVTRNLNQSAVMWAVSTAYAADGTQKVSAGTQIPVRWEYRNEDILDPSGNSIRSDVKVMLDRAVSVHSLLWLGELIELPTDLSTLTDLFEVISLRSTPTLKATSTQFTAFLIRYQKSLPTIV